MATGSYIHEVRCNRISFLTIFVILLELLQLSHHVRCHPVDLSSDSDVDEGPGNNYWTTIVMPVAFLLSIVLIAFVCAGGCCQWFGRRRVIEVPMGFSNPVADGSMMMPISQIDVRALELDPVVFEPLPAIHDLTPMSLSSSRFCTGDRSRDSFDPRTQTSPIVPFSGDESNIYAHDWFDEPYRNFRRGNIEYVKEVGKGWFGQVIEAEARDIVPFARKIRVLVKVLREDATGVEQMRFLDESRWYRDSNHGNILKLLGHSIETLPFLLIMEHCPQGDLKSFLIANVTRAEMLNSQGAIVGMALDIAKGLAWMATADFIHADLATRNCQVGSEGRVLIGDYGLATQTFRDDYYWSSNIAIPLRWTAPETLHCTINTIQTLKVTKLSNVWTFGVVLWEICEFGKLPYFELSDDEVISRAIIDKNYTLGQPTMPCLAAKEQLYQLMKSCWNPIPEKRPAISVIVEQLELIAKSVPSIMSPKDEFESKWEQLAKTPPSVDNKGRKKNVSFLGFEEMDGEDEIFPKGIVQTASLGDAALGRVNENNLSIISQPSFISSSSQMELTYPDQWKAESLSQADPDEEHYWRKLLERGDISQKVREKSQSVQDLMVLTHVEASELSDPDSFIMISKSAFQATAMGLLPSGNTKIPSNGIVTNVVNGNSNSNIKKSSSETALNSLSAFATNSSQTPNVAALKPTTTAFTMSPLETLNGEIKINRSISTPENPVVQVRIIEPTPTQSSNQSIYKIPMENGDHQTNSQIHVKPRLKSIFNPSPVSPKNRHTSTPLRTPSPQLNFDGENDSEAEVFHSISPVKGNNITWNISPISHVTDSTLDLDRQFTSIVMGPSDDLGLKPYQKVTTELNNTNTILYDADISVEDNNDETMNSLPKVNFRLGCLESEITKGQALPKTAVPRVLFPPTQNTPLILDTPSDTTQSLFFSTTSYSHSNGDISEAEKHCDAKVGITSLGNESSILEPLFVQDTLEFDSSAADVEKNSEDAHSDDMEEFWAKQMQSFQEAAGNTRALFQLGLGQDGDQEPSKDKFVEDIEAATEELGSLVMHDLEEESSTSEVVKETREAVGEASFRSKIAFEGDDGCEDDSYPADWEPEPSDYENSTEVTLLSLNSSIALTKKAKAKEMASSTVSLRDFDFEESEMEDDTEDICMDFVPSKWNQNLAPTKPAIKSPEQTQQLQLQQPVHKSSLRKSVSFERKKPQLVYEYPPPPPASDSDDDDKISLATSLPMALSSSLDWELTQEELEDSEINHEDWGEDDVIPKAESPMDVYRISGFGDEHFQVRGSNEPFVFSPSTLGELRHTRDRLKLDLSKGEASILDEETKGAIKLDSGVGSSTNVSPFNHCDNHA